MLRLLRWLPPSRQYRSNIERVVGHVGAVAAVLVTLGRTSTCLVLVLQ
jgi:hypothetical protein